MLTTVRPQSWIAELRRFVAPPPPEVCELCGVLLPSRHRHVVEPATRRVLCACFACGESVEGRAGRAERRHVLVPDRAEALSDFQMSEAEWHALGVPVEMAFVFHATPAGGPVALYPGPLGATESAVTPAAWAAVAAQNPVLGNLEPDIEALLIDRRRGRRTYYRVPIDRCYALVGTMRTRWQGWSGGDEVWQAIDAFMGELAA